MVFDAKSGEYDMRIAMHGAVYGQNFGDVLIQKVVSGYLQFKLGAEVFYPFATRSFGAACNQATGDILSLSSSDEVVFGPGGYLGQRNHNRFLWNMRLRTYHGSLFRLTRRYGLPLFLFGVGVGPLENSRSRSLVGAILDYASFIQVRDSFSFEYAKSIVPNQKHIGKMPDVAMLLDQGSISEPEKKSIINLVRCGERMVVAIHVPLPGGKTSSSVKKFFCDLILLVEHNPQYLFVIIYDSPRQVVYRQVRSQLLSYPNVIEDNYIGPERLLALISQCSIVLSTKLHVGICATALGVRSVSVYFHPKVERFYHEIGQLDYCTYLGQYEGGWLDGAIRGVLTSDRSDLRSTVNEMRDEVSARLGELSANILASV